jgi:hypothetical protein
MRRRDKRMDYEKINFDSELANNVLNNLKDKEKIKGYSLNMAVAKCQTNLARFDLVERTEENMLAIMMKKIEDENQIKEGTFIYLTKSQNSTKDAILLTLSADIYSLSGD